MCVCVYLLVLISCSLRSKTGPGPVQPPQPQLHLPPEPAQRRARPGGGRRGGRRRLRPAAPPSAAAHAPVPLPHLLQLQRLAKRQQLPVHPSFHPVHAVTPFRWLRLSHASLGPAPGTGTGQPLRRAGLQTRIDQVRTTAERELSAADPQISPMFETILINGLALFCTIKIS